MLLGVDVGGTFTDAVAVTPAGEVYTAKTPTTPADQSEGVLRAIAAVLERAGAQPHDVTRLAHGMTVATNALLEGNAARTALIASEGMGDIVELGRQARAHLYRLCERGPRPLAVHDMRFEALERMGPSGAVWRALDADAAARLVERVAQSAPQAVAVVLLHSYANAAHEQLLGALLHERMPDVHVSLSSELVGTFREYERAATTEVDAALSPLLRGYLERLTQQTTRLGLPRPQIMQSSGGLISARHAGRHAALTVLSGPAGGVGGALELARRAGVQDAAVCVDMGGTSCDVCTIEDGRVAETAQRTVAGRPLALPALDIHTVGAGGGSIAWRDSGGALRVGPHSAGAQPGPACYRRGGSEATVTDANLLLGRLPADAPLAGVTLDREAARAAVARLAQTLDLDATSLRGGHPARRAGADGGRDAHDDRGPRQRPARDGAAALRRRRATARLRAGGGAWHRAHRVSARERRALRAGIGRGGPPARRGAYGAAARRGAECAEAGKRARRFDPACGWRT